MARIPRWHPPQAWPQPPACQAAAAQLSTRRLRRRGAANKRGIETGSVHRYLPNGGNGAASRRDDDPRDSAPHAGGVIENPTPAALRARDLGLAGDVELLKHDGRSSGPLLAGRGHNHDNGCSTRAA